MSYVTPLLVVSMLLVGPACAEQPPNALDDLLVAIDATRSVRTGRFSAVSSQQSILGAFSPAGVSLLVDKCPDLKPPCPEIRLIGGLAYVKSAALPSAGASTEWVSVHLDRLGPLEDLAPGLADEIAALGGGAPPPGMGPTLAALRTSTSASQATGRPVHAQLDLSNISRLAPRDQDAVVAWAGLWSRRGGMRDLEADAAIAPDGRLDQVTFDPAGDSPAGPLTVSFIDLDTPVTVATPLPEDTTALR